MPIFALLDPKNFAPESGGRFKEGYVRVDKSVFTVHQEKLPENATKDPKPAFTALKWNITRLTEDLQPAMDADENPLTEQLVFSLGGKSLTMVHPANGSTYEDPEPEDLGTGLGVEGNTLYLLKEDFQLHPKSGVAHLMASMKKVGYTPEHLARVWAPDFNGVIFRMKTELSDDKIMGSDGIERPIPYKVVDKFVANKSKHAPSNVVSQPRKPAAKAGGSEAEAALEPILLTLSETLDGQAITRKALSTKISGLLQSSGVDARLHIPALALVKDAAWLAKNSAKYDLAVDAEQGLVTFGTVPATGTPAAA